MKFSFKIFLYFFFRVVFYIYSQTPSPVYKHITSTDGLANDITYQIIQDSEGYIWIGTDDGLSKYDGKRFTNYINNGLRSNYVIDILEDKKNNSFVLATWNGGLHFLKNDSIYSFQNKKDDNININRIHKLNDSIIIGRSSGEAPFYYYNLNKKNIVVNYISKKLNTSKKGKLYIDNQTYSQLTYSASDFREKNDFYIYASHLEWKRISSFKGVYKVSDSSTIKKLNLPKLNNKLVHGFFKEKQNIIATSYNKMFFYKNNEFIEEKKFNLGLGKIIQLQANHNKVYFVFNSEVDNLREVYSYSLINKQLINISKQLDITSPISDILIDTDNNLWITTYGQGIYKVSNNKNSFLGKEAFENPDLRDIGVFDNNLFLLSHSLLYLLDKKGKVFSKKTPFYTETFQLEKNKLSLITPHLQSNTKTTKFLQYKIPNKGNEDFSFKIDSLTILFDHHEYEISNGKTIIRDSISENINHFVRNALIHNNQILMNYGRIGVYTLNLKTKRAEKWHRTKDLNINIVSDILKDRDTIWVATNAGAYKITPRKTILYSTDSGLSSNHINHLYKDTHNRLWAGTQKGLNVLYKNHFYTIDKSIGQLSSTIKKIVEKDQNLYAAGNKGLFVMNNTVPFKTSNNTKLIIKQNNSFFKLNTINYVNSETIIIAYKLNNAPWVETTNNTLNFSNLKQGSYSITFKFKDNLSNWKFSKQYLFQIVLPWHQQAWFYVTITFLILSILIILLWNGLKKSIKKNQVLKNTIDENEKLQAALKEVRKNVARDFHDELGNKLASIAITSNLLLDSEYSSNEKNKQKKLHQIKKDADFLYSGMKDFVWSLDHKNDDLYQLQMYLNDFGENLFSNSPISFYSIHNLSEEKTPLPYYWSKQLVLIFKEAMTNTLKHSNASKVFLKFSLKDQTLKIILHDNGIGFDSQTQKRINGIQNMMHRANTLNQILHIESNDGVTITFIGNLKTKENE